MRHSGSYRAIFLWRIVYIPGGRSVRLAYATSSLVKVCAILADVDKSCGEGAKWMPAFGAKQPFATHLRLTSEAV
jgi:hypothetical protein